MSTTFPKSKRSEVKSVMRILLATRYVFLLLLIIGRNLASSGPSLERGGIEKGFVPLFNGSDLAGWEGDANIWKVENGMIVGRSPGVRMNRFLATTSQYENFIL